MPAKLMCRTFEVEYEYFGAVRRVELKPGGSNINVTTANRTEYVQLYTHWLLDVSIEKQFNAFSIGFHQVGRAPGGPLLPEGPYMLCGVCAERGTFSRLLGHDELEGRMRPAALHAWHGRLSACPTALRPGQVCGGPALSLFRSEELELLLAGLPHLDFGDLERGTRYEGGYSTSSATVRAFWQVLGELSMDAKRRLLAFFTGCDRAPVAGLGALTLTIQRAGADSERLPSAHTCFNVLLLPDYGSKAKLRAKLLTAIENGQGFGLK